MTLDEALKMFDDAVEYVDTGFRVNWDNYFRVYKGQRVIRQYEGISDPVIRESHTIIETLVANIAGGSPKFHFVKTNEEQTDDTDVLNGMLDYYMTCNQMGLKNQEWVRDMLLYGTGILHVTWREGKPNIENIPLRDFFVDPLSTGLTQTTNPARYAGYRYFVDKTVLEREMIYDPEKNKMVPRYKNLEKIGFDKDAKTGGAGNGDKAAPDKAFKDMFNGSTLGDSAVERQVAVIKLYDLMTGRLVEIGNRKEFIYNEPTWCQREEEEVTVEVEVDGQVVETKKKLSAIKPFLPFAVLRDYVDTSLFYGEGEMAIIMGDAELLNDYEAMDVDNNAYQNTPMYQIDPQFADLAPEIETIPGAVYPIPKGAISPLERPQLSQDLDNKKERIAARMRRATAADDAVQGVSQSSSRTTATEVSSQLAQAQNRFSTKLSNLESEGYAQLGGVIVKLIQIFITRKTAIRIVGPKGVAFRDFDPWEYDGEWEPHVELDTTIKMKQMEVGQKQNQIFEILTNDPNGVFDPVEIKRFMVQTINPDITDEKFNKMLAPPAQPNEDSNDKDYLQVNYKDLEPWGRRQAQIDLGWDPDPSLQGDMQNRMVKQAAEGVDMMDPATLADGKTPVPGMEGLLAPPTPTPAQAPAGMQPSMA